MYHKGREKLSFVKMIGRFVPKGWPLCLSAISSEVFFVTFLAQVHDGLRARLLQPLVCGACPAKKESFSLGVGKETKILLPLCLPILSSQGFPGAIRCSRVE